MAIRNPKSPENNPRNAKNSLLLKTKRIIKPKYKFGGGATFTFISPEVGEGELVSRQLRHWL